MLPLSGNATAGCASRDAAWTGRRSARSMLTVCPKCALSLVVTAEDLRVAHGYVRCGRCSSVFNALARLSEERQPPEAAEAAAPASTGSPPAETAPPAAAAPYPPDAHALPEYALKFDPSETAL